MALELSFFDRIASASSPAEDEMIGLSVKPAALAGLTDEALSGRGGGADQRHRAQKIASCYFVTHRKSNLGFARHSQVISPPKRMQRVRHDP